MNNKRKQKLTVGFVSSLVIKEKQKVPGGVAQDLKSVKGLFQRVARRLTKIEETLGIIGSKWFPSGRAEGFLRGGE